MSVTPSTASEKTSAAPGRRLALSAIICTKDRPESLAATLETLWAQTRLPDEFVLIDDGRLETEPMAAAAGGRGVRFVYHNKSDHPGLALSRRAALERASGDVLLFLDDDVSLDPEYVKGIMVVYETDPDGRIGGATGRLEGITYQRLQMFLLRFFLMDDPAREGAILKNFIGVLVRNIQRPTDVQWLSGCNMSYRREAIAGVEIPVDLEGWSAGEDRALSYQVGRRWRLVATPDARLVHHRIQSARLSAERVGFQQVYYNYLHFARYMPQDLSHRAAFAWFCVGCFFINSMRWDFGRVWGNVRGMARIVFGPRPQREMAPGPRRP
jgi:glycosyltransferase involved in cell wall biosynthesis